MNRNLFNCQFRCNQCGYFHLIEFYYKNNMPLIKLICPKNHLKNDINLEHLSNVSTSLICSNSFVPFTCRQGNHLMKKCWRHANDGNTHAFGHSNLEGMPKLPKGMYYWIFLDYNII